jgi:L-threonylcarbamoyladenylate synthase
MPNHPIALELIDKAGVPIAAPSANRFTGLSPTIADHVRQAFGDSVAVLDGGPATVGIESTVVAIENGELILLRPGMISLGDLELHVANEDSAHPAPGMHARHYSPRTPVLLVAGPKQLPDRLGAYLWYRKPGLVSRSIHMPSEASRYAARLYAAMHELDAEGWPWIGVESPPDAPEWTAIRDRLRRAAGRE